MLHQAELEGGPNIELLSSVKGRERPLLGRLHGRKTWKTATRIIAAVGITTLLGLAAYTTSKPPIISIAQGNNLETNNNPLLSDDTEVIQTRALAIADIPSFIPSLSALQPFRSQGLEMTRVIGTGSESEVGILFLGDKFDSADNQKFLQAVETATNTILSTEPFTSSRQRFSAYALSLSSTPNLDCFGNNPNFPLCDDNIVRATINQATLSTRVNLVQTMVIINSSHPQGKSYIGKTDSETSRFNYSLVSTAVVGDGITPLHEFLHGFVGLLDEYNFGFPNQSAFYLWPNCVPLPERSWAYLGTDNPGRSFPGCRNTENGYRDAENDIMKMGKRELGPADMYWTKKAIMEGLSRYKLLSMPPLSNRIFLPTMSINKP